MSQAQMLVLDGNRWSGLVTILKKKYKDNVDTKRRLIRQRSLQTRARV